MNQGITAVHLVLLMNDWYCRFPHNSLPVDALRWSEPVLRTDSTPVQSAVGFDMNAAAAVNVLAFGVMASSTFPSAWAVLDRDSMELCLRIVHRRSQWGCWTTTPRKRRGLARC